MYWRHIECFSIFSRFSMYFLYFSFGKHENKCLHFMNRMVYCTQFTVFGETSVSL